MVNKLNTEAASRVRQQFWLYLLSQLGFLAIAPLLLRLFGLLDPETIFVAWFLWFLAMSEVFAPQLSDAGWWKWIGLIRVAGYVAFTFVMIQRVVPVLQ
ncbi:hypothetical protein [Haloarcula litorea]|uniref:hypothetical protein n=1 Tax=Haloarcula litorea TaxID=3032579 RepID=UPI0023E7CC68|nr:hypothetical protein [Halomicroarcula sp. GDY20]